MPRFPILLASIFLVGAVSSLAAPSAPFQKAASAAVAALERDDLETFLKMCTKPTVEVVRRGVDWNLSNAGEKWGSGGKFESQVFLDDPIGMEHGHPEILVWEEEEVEFHITDSQDRKSLTRILNRFRTEMKSGYGPVDISMTSTDQWRRNLGPAASGKICAGTFWFIYFTQENGQWKVSRLEYLSR